MLTLLTALLACFALMFLLGSEHAKDKAREAAEWQRHSDEAMALAMESASRQRHPSSAA